ncbi:PLC-like protein, partial [Mya arenaria]
CPPDHSFDSSSLLCIKLEEAAKFNFSEAQAFCRQTGDELVTLDTYAKFNFVQYAIIHHSKEEQQQRNYWIGAHANLTLSGKVFRWESLRTWNFTAWGPDEPDVDPSQLCVVLNVLENYEWFDTRCDSPYHFICEHDIFVNGGFTTSMTHPQASSRPLTTPSTPSTISPSSNSSMTSSSTTAL